MHNVGIYKIVSPSGKIYIGQSRNLKSRMKDYSILKCKEQTKIYHSLKKYGWKSHTWSVEIYLDNSTNQAIIDYWEQFFIDFYRDNGYELLNLKEGGYRGKLSIESRKKISKSRKNKPTHWTKGRKVPQEIIDKISTSISGEKHVGCKLSNLQVRIIYHSFNFGLSSKYLSKTFNVRQQIICDIKKGRTWSSVTNLPLNQKIKKITPSVVKMINDHLKIGGDRPVDVARMFNVNVMTVHNIKSGRTWNHLTNNKSCRASHL